MAEGGTLFLDEFGDVSPALQVRLLRALEEHAYMPLGSSKRVKADVRIITATHKDLERLVEEGAFRRDLDYRINVVKLTLPRLAERKEDIPLLAEHCIQRFNKLQNKKILGLSTTAWLSSCATTGPATSGNWKTPSSTPLSSAPKA